MAADIVPPTVNRRLAFIIVFAVLCVLLAGAYHAFLRADYTVLYSGLKPADASAIVTQLDAKAIPHKLRDGGTTILVPKDQADSSLLVVAGSDVPMKGAVGFELFNKSDMGLTDFAQKINYQRALQGELARTIMMMDGIENARVHLAIPERSLFRSKASTPRAAIEVITRDNQTIDPDRVAGIQQLVTSAVPDLPLDQVVVLDAEGKIVSRSRSVDAGVGPAVSEQSAVQDYYSARARTALATALPGVEFGVHTLVLSTGVISTGAAATSPSDTATPAETPAPSMSPQTGARNFQLRMTVVTPVTLNAEDQGIARAAVASAIALNESRGDSLAFQVAQMATAESPLQVTAPIPVDQGTAGDAKAVAAPVLPVPFDLWPLLVVLAGIGLIVWLVWRRQGAALPGPDRDVFVARLRQQLNVGGEDAHG